MSPANLKALRFHRRCEVTGRWPEDAIVVENAVIIREVEKRVDRQAQATLIGAEVAEALIPLLLGDKDV